MSIWGMLAALAIGLFLYGFGVRSLVTWFVGFVIMGAALAVANIVEPGAVNPTLIVFGSLGLLMVAGSRKAVRHER